MPFFRKDPFKDIDEFFSEDLFGFFPAIKRMSGPALDIYQTEKDVTVELQVPNIDLKNVDIEIESDVLTVSGKEEEEKEEKNKDYLRKEIKRGEFSRAIRLPVSVKSDQAQAEYKGGILKITMPKSEESRKNKIQIKSIEE